MIVKETRIVFGLDDILKFTIRCVRCSGEVTAVWRPDKTPTKVFDGEVQQCPHCGITWKESEDTQSYKEDREEIKALLKAIGHFTSSSYRERLQRSEAKWEVLFGIPGESI